MVTSPLSSQPLSTSPSMASPPLPSSPSMASPPKLVVPPNSMSDPSIDSSTMDELAKVSATNVLPRPDLSLSSPSVLDPKFGWVAPPELILNCAMESLMPSPGRFMESSDESPRYSLSEQFFNGEMKNSGSTLVKKSELATVPTPSPPANCENEQPEMLQPVENIIAVPQALAKANGKQVNINGNSSQQAKTLPLPKAGNGSVSVVSSTIQPLSHKPQGAWASPFKIAALFPAVEKNAPSLLQGREDVHSSINSGNEQWPSLNASNQTTSRRAPVSVKFSSEIQAQPITQEVIEASHEYPWAAKMKAVCNLRRVTTPVYMEDGTPKVSIPSHILLEGIENQNQFVVGQFYRCKAPSGSLIHAVATRIWGRKCRIFTRKLGESSYLFHIPDETTRKWVIQRGIWHIDDCLMFVSPWSPSPTIALPEISTIPVWLTLQNIPYQLYSIKGIDWIASGIGEPMLTSKPWLDPTQMGEAKILVEVKLNKPFPQRVALEDKSGSITMVNVLYSWLPSKCSCCGQLGHKASHCLGNHNAASDSVKENGLISSDAQKSVAKHVPPQADFASPIEVISGSETTTPAVGIPISVPQCNSVPALESQSDAPQCNSDPALESPSAVEEILTPKPSFEIEANLTETVTINSATEIDQLNEASVHAGPIVIDSTPITKDAQDATISKQGNPLSLLLSDLDPAPHSSEMTICTTEENEEFSMRLEGNQFALLDQNNMFDDSSTQTSRGGRQIKPTQKVQEMNWTIVGGRGNRGRGRGGRGKGGRG